MRNRLAAIGIAVFLQTAANTTPLLLSLPAFTMVQTMALAAGSEQEKQPATPEERMQARFPQPVRIADLIGLPILDDSHRTLGHVREVVRTKTNKILLVVAYGGFLGWGVRPVGVPIEAVGIRGRELASLDMPRSAYDTASTWQNIDAAVLSKDSSILVALCRGY